MGPKVEMKSFGAASGSMTNSTTPPIKRPTLEEGISYGGGRKHWSNMLLHNSFYSPYPFDLDLVQVEAVAFSWDEFCMKSGVPNEAVGDTKQCTFKGKPSASVVGPNLEAEGDAEMGDSTMPPPAAPAQSFQKAPAPSPGRGKSQGRGKNPQAVKGS